MAETFRPMPKAFVARYSAPLARALVVLLGVAGIGGEALGQTPTPKFRVLEFHGCGGFVHPSIPIVSETWAKLAVANGFALDTTANPSVFTTENLKKYDAVIFNNATYPGKILDSAQKAAWLTYAETKGYVGMHAAGDLGDSWPAYLAYMGGTNSQHSNTMPATMDFDTGSFASNHPIIRYAGLPTHFQFTEEWYSWRVNPRVQGVKVLYTVDEKTFVPGEAMGDDHPIVWVREMPKGGRMVYMGMGHNIDNFKPELKKGYDFVEKLMISSLLWVVNRNPGSGIHVTPKIPSRAALPTAVPVEGRFRLGYLPDGTSQWRFVDLSGRNFAP